MLDKPIIGPYDLGGKSLLWYTSDGVKFNIIDPDNILSDQEENEAQSSLAIEVNRLQSLGSNDLLLPTGPLSTPTVIQSSVSTRGLTVRFTPSASMLYFNDSRNKIFYNLDGTVILGHHGAFLDYVYESLPDAWLTKNVYNPPFDITGTVKVLKQSISIFTELDGSIYQRLYGRDFIWAWDNIDSSFPYRYLYLRPPLPPYPTWKAIMNLYPFMWGDTTTFGPMEGEYPIKRLTKPFGTPVVCVVTLDVPSPKPPPLNRWPKPWATAPIIEEPQPTGPVWKGFSGTYLPRTGLTVDNFKFVRAEDGSRADIHLEIPINADYTGQNRPSQKYSLLPEDWRPRVLSDDADESKTIKYSIKIYDRFGNMGNLGVDFSYEENRTEGFIFLDVFPNTEKAQIDIVWPPPYFFDTPVGEKLASGEFGKYGGAVIDILVEGHSYSTQTAGINVISRTAPAGFPRAPRKSRTLSVDTAEMVVASNPSVSYSSEYALSPLSAIDNVDLSLVKKADSFLTARSFIAKYKAARTPRMRTL